MPQRFYPTFPSGNFITLSLTYMSIIHFEVTFLCGVRYLSLFIVLHVDAQVAEHYILNDHHYFIDFL